MKKVFMSLAFAVVALASVSCACNNNCDKKAEAAQEPCQECCDSCCNACTACDSTAVAE